MLSNPVNIFVNGSTKEAFTYEGGQILFHFSPLDNNLSKSMENNLIFFANDEKHALDVLTRMLQFVCECNIKYLKYAHIDEFKQQCIEMNNKMTQYIDAIRSNKIKLSKAPTNQFYLTEWAYNATIH